MSRVLLTFISIFFLTLPLFAQSVDTAWVKRYNGPGNSTDIAQAITIDNSGNIYVTGNSSSGGLNDDYATIKYFPNGDTAWVRRYNGPGNASDWPSAIAIDGFGNVYVTGGSKSSVSENDYATIKYSPSGDTAWVTRYNGPASGNDRAYGLAVDDSGYVYVTGHSNGNGTSGDYATIKYYPNGDIVWVRRYNGPSNSQDSASAIAVDDSGCIYVTGWSYGIGTDYDIATIKYKPNGDTAWVRRYNGPRDSTDFALRMAFDASGNVYVAGTSTGIGTALDYLTIKYDSSGNKLWDRRYNGPGNGFDVVMSIALDSAGNAYVTGQSKGDATTSYDYATIKYLPNGDTAWARRYSRTPICGDNAFAIAIDRSGNSYVTGFSQCRDDSIRWDYATLKYDPNGNKLWERLYDGPASDSDKAYSITVDDFGSVYVTGGSFGFGSYFDYLTIKYVQFLRGDANSDKKVSLSDIVYLINYLFKFGPAPDPIQSGDANCDGKVSLGDIVYLINYLFKFGPAPCI